MEEVMEKLVEIVLFLNRELNNAFGSTNADTESSGSLSIGKRLGPAGLSLHYANIVQQIDSIVSRSSSVPSNAREILYHNLPPHIKSSLRFKLQTFHVNKEFTVTEIKVEMEKTLGWLAPIAANTSKAHHGFGWVGEWASTRSETNSKQGGMLEITRIETLHHADKGKTEDCILELVLWLNLMNKQTNAIAQSSMALPTNQVSTKYKTPTHNNVRMLRDISNRKRSLGMSKSQKFECRKVKLIKHDRLSKSSGHAPMTTSNDFLGPNMRSSGVDVAGFCCDKEKCMDAVDGLGTNDKIAANK